ncbi:MAG: alcohol dehydrogenase [Gemmatimonadetes bacterium]|nr:alcohol dehydrogenase [Gemmatimonadota bacterium]
MFDTRFDFDPSIRTVFGAGTLDQLGDLARAVAGPHALLVTDPGLVACGLAERAAHILHAADLTTTTFSAVAANPTTEHVDAGVAHARAAAPIDLIVALGGGSAMDCAKGINFVLTNGGPMEAYHGHGQAARAMLPSIGIPTTAGTGSEAQSYALIARADTGEKMACGDRKARFHAVILDPELIASAPDAVSANAGIDAIAHAVESYVTTRRNLVSTLFAREAWRLLAPAFPASIKDSADPTANAAMLLGAHYAGTAIENAMLGAAHATANPLTARYHIPHGQAVALMLPHVIRINGKVVDDLYGELCTEIQLSGGADALADHIIELKNLAGLPQRLSECQVAEDRLCPMAEEATHQWTGTFNPLPLKKEDFLHLYTSAF